MQTFFTPADDLQSIITDTLKDQKIISSTHILTGWTNIVMEVKTSTGSFFFRFPRNPFWSKMLIKDAAVCNFVDGKTSFYTPQMQLHYDTAHRPFSVHRKIEGYTMKDRIYHLSHTALTASAYDIAKFVKELSSINLKNAPQSVKYPLSDFLKELDDRHFSQHLSADHSYIRQTESQNLVHGDLNLGNIILDQNDKVIGVIDFCFAGTGNPNMDASRIISRSVPSEFETVFRNQFADQEQISHMKKVWQHIDAGYAAHIRANFPEITL